MEGGRVSDAAGLAHQLTRLRKGRPVRAPGAEPVDRVEDAGDVAAHVHVHVLVALLPGLLRALGGEEEAASEDGELGAEPPALAGALPQLPLGAEDPQRHGGARGVERDEVVGPLGEGLRAPVEVWVSAAGAHGEGSEGDDEGGGRRRAAGLG